MEIRGLRWAECVIRMSDSEMPARILNCNPEGKIKLVTPKARWFNAVDNDVGRRVREWRIENKDRH